MRPVGPRLMVGVFAAALVLLALSNAASAQTGYQLDSASVADPCVASPALHVHGNGFAPNVNVTAVLSSNSVTLGTAVADSSGVADGNFTLPSGFGSGSHTLTLTGPNSTGGTRTLEIPFTIGSCASGPLLAFTGSNVGTMVAVAAAAVLIGATAVVGGRRRRRALAG